MPRLDSFFIMPVTEAALKPISSASSEVETLPCRCWSR